MLDVSTPETAEFPRAVKQILQDGLQLRDRRDQGQIGERGMAIATGKIEARMDRVLEPDDLSDANRRLANHLLRERDAIFSFLRCPGLDATNFRAEQAIRPMVVTRKTWGGNRTQTGAHTQSVLTSIVQTCRQQLRSPIDAFKHLLCSRKSQVLDLTLPPSR
jgi:transposase